MKITKQEHERALEDLRRIFPKGSTVYTLALGRSRSGMARWYSVVSISKDGRTSWPNWAACAGANVGHFVSNYEGRTAIRINGCGFSASAEIHESLCRALGHQFKHQEL